MKKFFLFFFSMILVPSSLWAEVGKSFEETKKNDFFTFFHFSVTKERPLLEQWKFLHCKPGGFKEYIDLNLVVQAKGLLQRATLYLERSWIRQGKTYNVFARDIAKSFVWNFVGEKDREKIKDLVNQIFRATPTQVGVHPGFEVFLGKKRSHKEDLSSCRLEFFHQRIEGRVWFVAQISVLEEKKEEPLKTPSFLKEEDLKPYGLVKSQSNSQFQVFSTEEKDALIFRMVDIRWSFSSPLKAQIFHFESLKENCENLSEVPLPENQKFGEDLFVYMADENSPLIKRLGLKNRMYCFIFRKNNFVAKVFVAGSDKLTLEEASKIAKKAEAGL